MAQKIKKIFKRNIELLGDIDKSIIYFREQQYEKALSIVVKAVDDIKYIIEAILANQEYFNLVNTDSVLQMISSILEAQRNKDYILLADLFDLQLISFLTGIQELIIKKEGIQFNEDSYHHNIRMIASFNSSFAEFLSEPIDPSAMLESGYSVEFSSCGLMTLATQKEESRFYFHTNNRVLLEAFLLARNWAQQNKRRYIIYGLGMGYHINELLALSPEAEVVVYEADHNVIQLASAFTDMKELLQSDRMKLIYDPSFQRLKERLSYIDITTEALLIHYPSYKNIRNASGRELMESYLPWSKTLDYC